MILSSVFFLSFSALAFEILLARLFSISQWNNLYFMVISVALLGFASGGVLFFFLDTRIPGWETRWSEKGPLAFLLLGFTASALLSLFVLSKIPFDYFRLPFEPVQGLYLLALYLMLGAVFFFCGLAVMIGYAALPEKSGRVYFASMAGSACGAAAAIPLLSFFGETGAAALSVLPPLIPAAGDCLKGFAGRPAGLPDAPDPKYGKLTVLPSAFLIALAAYFVFFGDPPLARVGPSPYKALSQALQFPDTRVFKEASSIYGRVDCLESPHLRHAPGLSLKFPDAAPGQWTAFRDGDHPLGFYPKDGDPAFARSTLQYAGYVLRPDPDRVLVLQTGGGTAIPCALASGARQIVAVETHPHLAHLLQAHYGIEVVWEAPRAYLAQTGTSFDVIHLENWGPSLPGTAALNPDALLTVEAFGACLNRLSPTGILMVSRRLRLPPGDTLRLWSTAHAALSRAGVSDPGRHLLVLRNWDTFALIVSRPPLPDLGPVVDFARRLNFDFVFASPPVTDPVNRYNRFPEAYYHQALAELAAAHRKGREDAFFDAYLLDVEPRADDRPYPDRFIKYGRILDLYRSTGSRFFTLFMSGEILVSVVLLEAAAISALLLLLPVFSLHRKKKNKGGGFSLFFFFFLLGSGFMFFEMAFIQAVTLLLGDPVVSFIVVAAGFLFFSGAGGGLSQRLERGAMHPSLWVMAALGLLGFFTLDAVLHQVLNLGPALRAAAAAALLLPAGLPAGLPFPLGMRLFLDAPSQRAFAWGANGIASVLTAVAAVQAAIGFGISANLLLAGASYLLASFCFKKAQKAKSAA